MATEGALTPETDKQTDHTHDPKQLALMLMAQKNTNTRSSSSCTELAVCIRDRLAVQTHMLPSSMFAVLCDKFTETCT